MLSRALIIKFWEKSLAPQKSKEDVNNTKSSAYYKFGNLIKDQPGNVEDSKGAVDIVTEKFNEKAAGIVVMLESLWTGRGSPRK